MPSRCASPSSSSPCRTPDRPRKIILDCDPGHDDAVAILLAAENPAIELAGIATIGGNQSLEKVTRKARVVLSIADIDGVPVHADCRRPLVGQGVVAAEVHGGSRMGVHGYAMPEPTVPLDDAHTVDFIIDTVMSEPVGTGTLVPTGPLTNIAMAACKGSTIVDRVAEVVLMGGGYHEAITAAPSR